MGQQLERYNRAMIGNVSRSTKDLMSAGNPLTPAIVKTPQSGKHCETKASQLALQRRSTAVQRRLCSFANTRWRAEELELEEVS